MGIRSEKLSVVAIALLSFLKNIVKIVIHCVSLQTVMMPFHLSCYFQSEVVDLLLLQMRRCIPIYLPTYLHTYLPTYIPTYLCVENNLKLLMLLSRGPSPVILVRLLFSATTFLANNKISRKKSSQKLLHLSHESFW